jgi:hypothetical protein
MCRLRPKYRYWSACLNPAMPLASLTSSDSRGQGHQSTNSPSHGLNQIQREDQLDHFQLEGLFN